MQLAVEIDKRQQVAAQPINRRTVNLLDAALRLLGTQPPDLDLASQALDDIIKDGRRVSQVIDRIRALIRKSPTQIEVLDINELIMETMALTRSEILNDLDTTATPLDGQTKGVWNPQAGYGLANAPAALAAAHVLKVAFLSPAANQRGTHKIRDTS